MSFEGGNTIAGKETRADKVRCNGQIRAPEIRLIGEDGEQVGVVTLVDALKLVKEAQLDLVEISPNSAPPVCRVMDYGKFIYQQQKRLAVAKKKQKRVQVKVIQFRPTTEEGDYQVKMRKLCEFLDGGNKVKVAIRFRGREFAHAELGSRVLERIKTDVSEFAEVEQMPKMEGRQMTMVIGPKRGQKRAL